jgi:hypothetical protein
MVQEYTVPAVRQGELLLASGGRRAFFPLDVDWVICDSPPLGHDVPDRERRTMIADFRKWSCRRWMPALILTLALVQGLSGCALFPAGESSGSRPWTDPTSQPMRSSPPDSATAVPAKKEPFWEKYRDKRVGEINQNLNVEEPAGW